MTTKKNVHTVTAEQKEKAKACKTPEEMLALAKDEGYELSDEELEDISGGEFWDNLADCRHDF